MKKLSNQDSKKVYTAITETISLIQKENKYSFDLRKHDYIERLENHLNKLYKMIEVGEIF